MKHWVLSIVLALASPSLLAAPERVADVLTDLRTHGYVSPSAAAARLQAASDAADPRAPIEQRRSYCAQLIALSIPDRNTHLLQQALASLQQMAQREHCKPCQATWLIGEAQAAMSRRDVTSARADLRQAATLIAANDDAMQLELILAQVHLERQQGAMNVAFDHAMKGLELAARLGDPAARVKLQLDLTVIDADLGYLPRAAAMAPEVIAQARSIGFTAALAQAYINQGYVYSQLDERPAQLRALQQALEVSKNVPGLRHVEAAVRINLSDYYLHQGGYDDALEYGQEGAALAKADNDAYLVAVALANQGLAAAGMGRAQMALDTLQESMEFARRSGNLRAQSIVSQELVKQLQAVGRYKDALQLLESMDEVNQKITEQKRDTAVLELQARYDDERKNRQIEQLSTQARLTEAQASARLWQQRLWTTLATAAVLSALLMVLWLLHARRANRRLTQDVASLTEQSALDELTGVFNRRHFAGMMQPYEHDPEARVGLVMVDVDHFKRVNDNLGHDAGDLVLTEVARRLQALVRAHDHVVRWGGEEFVLVLPGATPQGLPQMARRLLDAVAGTPIQVGDRQLRVSVSAGCVVHPLESGSSWDSALRLADTLMYRAKRHGRNRAACVVMLDEPAGKTGFDGGIAAAHSGTVEVVEVVGPALAEMNATG
ncbi:MAG: GGDEF domain-containing protein [Xanthomonadales bacterium]|nr:GGDEF domain-containing protein [Xanthomonadales bacterium]ODU91952.1 MAG: hypothetical protein ABT18_13830 [Rhodanobacter sp. SCN 66-43]OJY84992.1 MAG: hypothetical protein BGP23_11395 [Xanthomonadales bacterium 66-474]